MAGALSLSCLVAVQANQVGDTDSAGVVIPSQMGGSHHQVRNQVAKTFDWINAIAGGKTLKLADMRQYFSEDVHYQVNGKVMADNLSQLFKRFKLLRSKYRSAQIELPLKQVTVANNQAAVRYTLTLTNNSNVTYRDAIDVQLTLQNGKIRRWQAVIAHA